MQNDPFEIFLTAPPGLESTLAEEVAALDLGPADTVPGGVTIRGGWAQVWQANHALRGATRVLMRLGGFRVFHLAQLDKRSRKFPWADVLRPDVPLKIETTSRKSKVYHARAATDRIARAITEELGAPVADDAPLRLMARIEDDYVTFSLDTSGEPLHKRGHKQAVGKAPMRESLAALFLRQCGYDGREPVLDPMCGSGTFPIEAAEIAAGLRPGRSRSFAYKLLAGYDAAARDAALAALPVPIAMPELLFHGSDRDAGAVTSALANAERAGVAGQTRFVQTSVGDLVRPEGPPGLVMVNPPYGGRIGNKKLLFALHGTLGARLKDQFSGWRVGIITNEPQLAHATGLPFVPSGPPIPHGGLKVKLYRTDPLP
ncbi:THUMP domain-containing class I SAM-dependent RNA methyltransferase [Pseudooceanicola aestuarii]|uniref:THUMP domain-containing class I SAM-dependent RNA methyltransferase n=1 Tax=Pseudooceanicola aestuarii TaxID=2697319 RepID=UPI0013D4F789|nr:class I SAM-dependent RNA methyltransferase [Pseudooceanicola aestuarii]